MIMKMQIFQKVLFDQEDFVSVRYVIGVIL